MLTTGKLINLSLSILLLTGLPADAAVVRTDDSDAGQKLNLPVYEWSDKDVPEKGVIVAVHGLTFYATAFDDLATHLAQKGYTFYAADIRGFGRWKKESAKFHGDDQIHFTQSEEDLVNLLKLVHLENPGEKVFCLGESLGANYALWVASTEPKLVDGAIAGSPCVKCCVHPRLRWIVDFIQGLLHPKHPLNLEPYITPYLSHDKALTRSCLSDAKICRKLSPVDLVKTNITNKRTLEQVSNIPAEMPILVFAGSKDKVFKTSALRKFVPELGSQHVVLKVFPKKGHLLVEHQPVQPELASLLDDWLDRQSNTSETVVKVP